MATKLNLEYLNSINDIITENNDNIELKFGNWITNEDILLKLKTDFEKNKPFSHCIINNFLNIEFAEKIEKTVPAYNSSDNWYTYNNPLEVKYARDDLSDFPVDIQYLFYLLSSNYFLCIMKTLTGIHNLEIDDYLHGAGIHLHPRGGRLNMHLDYEKHPISGKQRRINFILYMNKEWNESWNGATELWDSKMIHCVKKIQVNFNTALIFQTNEISWHGLPDPINCPEGMFRKSIAYYYISPLISKDDKNKVGSDKNGYRLKACYCKRPKDKYDKGIDSLYKIRPYRRITEEDLKIYCPNWNYLDDLE